MPGTSQRPLKHPRKADPELHVYKTFGTDLLNRRPILVDSRLHSEDSYSHSSIYDPSSSLPPSSPIPSPRTPEPAPSSMAHFRVSSSPKSFWEVVVDRKPGFRHIPHSSTKSSPTDSTFSHTQLSSRRRSSSASVPALMSDADTSEYSEDIDPFSMDLEDDAAEDLATTGNVKIEKSPDVLSNDTGAPVKTDQTIKEEQNWDGEFDIASVLLDLKRQVRLTSVKPELVTPPIETENASVERDVEGVDSSFKPKSEELAVIASTAISCTNSSADEDKPKLESLEELRQSKETIPSSVKHEIDCEEILPIVSDLSDTQAEQRVDEPSPAEKDLHLERLPSIINEEKESRDESTYLKQETPTDIVSVITPALSTATTLTPLSSPLSSPISRVSDIEPLSPLSSPSTCVTSLPQTPAASSEPCPDPIIPAPEEKPVPRQASPIPGPSKPRALTLEHDSHSLNPNQTEQSWLTLVEVDEDSAAASKKRKRPCTPNLEEQRPTSCKSSRSSSPTPRPRKKRGSRSAEDADECHADGKESTDMGTSSTACLSHQAVRDSPAPRALDPIADTQDCAESYAFARSEMHGCLIQAMALSRASSMPTSTLVKVVLRENAHLTGQRSKDSWLEIVQDVLRSHDVFGRIDRVGLDADDKPLEAQWYYIPENDPDQDRASLLREMMPKKRRETKKHVQYFYKPLAKISRWDAEDEI